MSSPRVSFSVVPQDAHRVLLEIHDASGTWQLPIERAQALQLATQLQRMSEPLAELPPQQELQRFLEHSMVRMPSGVLWMGAMPEAGLTTDAMPRHRVDVVAFEMSAIPVTQGLWHHIMGINPVTVHTGSKKPVHNISWWDALTFCNRLSEKMGLVPAYQFLDGLVQWNRSANGYRLPTEAEWEYASRTQDDLRFSGADSVDSVAWVIDNAPAILPDVGMKEPNLWGFHDMSGLVFEWCWDPQMPYSPTTENPEEPQEPIEAMKACRGGSWMHDSKWAMCTARFGYPAEFKGMVGLRIVRSHKPS